MDFYRPYYAYKLKCLLGFDDIDPFARSREGLNVWHDCGSLITLGSHWPIGGFPQFCRYIIGISLKADLSLVTVTHFQGDRVQDVYFPFLIN